MPGPIRPGIFFWDMFPFVAAGIRPKLVLNRQNEGGLLCIRESFLSSRARHPWRGVHGHSEADEVQVEPNHGGLSCRGGLSITLGSALDAPGASVMGADPGMTNRCGLFDAYGSGRGLSDAVRAESVPVRRCAYFVAPFYEKAIR